MAERNPCLWLQNRTDHTAENERSIITALLGGREGVLGANDLKVTQRGAGANMSVDVASGRAAINGDDAATTQGAYAVWNDATKNLTIAAADPTNPRKDIVVARVRDAFYSGATNAWALEVVTGTPAASPTAPATPNNAIVLATVDVAALASSITNANITDSRQRAVAIGSAIPCTAATRPSSPTAGMEIYETDTGRRWTYSGSVWVPATSLFVGTKTTQSINHATESDVTWTDSSDTDGWHSGSSANIIVPTGWAGIVEAEATITWPNDADGYRDARWNVASTDMPSVRVLNAGGLTTGQQVSLTTAVSGGETIKLIAVHTAGNSLNVTAGRVTVKFTSF